MNKENLRRWEKSILIGLFFFTIFSVYLYLRRGYYNLYIVNKVFGSTSVILAGITLLVGSLSKTLPTLTKFMTIRRQLGLLAFIFGLFHIVVSLAQSERFAWFSWYLNEWIPVGFGLVAIIIWTYMAYISRNKKIQEMGADIWKSRLSISGKLGFLTIFLHLTIMKYQGWLRWLDGQVKQTPELSNPSYPPASLFVFIFMVGVILYRLINDFRRKREVISQQNVS